MYKDLTFIFCTGAWVRDIVVDPVGGNIYFLSRNEDVSVIKADGSGRTTLNSTPGFTITYFAFDVDNR